MEGSGDFFDSFAGKFDTFYDGKRHYVMRWIDRRFRADMFERFARTFSLLGDLTGRSVLDVGCGSGPYIEEALKRGAASITGIDAAPSMLDLTRRRIAPFVGERRVTLLQGYFPSTIPDRLHDYGIVMGVMDYVEHAPEFLDQLYATITAGAVISFPSVHWFRSPVRRVRYRLRRCPLFLYSEADIQRLLESVNIRKHKIHKIAGAGLDFLVWIER